METETIGIGQVYRVKADGRLLVVVGFDAHYVYPYARNLKTGLLRRMRRQALALDCERVDVDVMTDAEINAWLCREPLPERIAALVGPQQDAEVEHVAHNLYNAWRDALLAETGPPAEVTWRETPAAVRVAWRRVAKATSSYRVGR